MIPPFDPVTGYLPAGEHEATWDEVVWRFGWNERRRTLLAGLSRALTMLAAAGCTRVWLNGSFVTSKDEPGDFDLTWDTQGVDETVLDPAFLDFTRDTIILKAMFDGEVFPNVTEAGTGLLFVDYFQRDKVGRRKGIIALRIEGYGEST